MPLKHLTAEEYTEWLLRRAQDSVQNRPETPLWQSKAWKGYQESLGRETRLYGLKSGTGEIAAAALVIVDRTAFGLSTWDIPRGPLGENSQKIGELLEGIMEEAKKERCMAISFSPLLGVSLSSSNPSSRHEQPEASVILDVRMSDEELLAKMKEKGRYNIRVAEKHKVSVTESRDVDAFYSLLTKTAMRDRYGIKPKSHYEKFLTELPGSFLLLAEVPEGTQKKTLAGLIGVLWGDTGIYYYGASDHAERAKMAPYALQFEAMKLCKARGATHYDLFGIAPTDDPSHAWAGVTRFKKQFGGEVVMYPPEQEIVLMPVMKTLLEWKRNVVG